MGQISTMFVRKVVGVAAPAYGGDQAKRRALFESVGVVPDARVDRKLMIRDSDYYDLCEGVARETDHGPTLAIRVGSSMHCDDYVQRPANIER